MDDINMDREMAIGGFFYPIISSNSCFYFKLVNSCNIAQDFCRSERLNILLDTSPVSREDQLNHAWNDEDRSPNIYICRDDKLACRKKFRLNNTTEFFTTTDSIRGKVGFTEGLHIWEIYWANMERGLNSVIGVATKKAPLTCSGRRNLVGSNDQSWGWDLGDLKLLHDSKRSAMQYPILVQNDEIYIVPNRIIVVLDMDEGNLSFMADGYYLGVAFRDLKGRKLYPTFSSEMSGSGVRMKYIGGLFPGPPSLFFLSRYNIRRKLNKGQLEKMVTDLHLPFSIRNYLLHPDRWTDRRSKSPTLCDIIDSISPIEYP